MRAAAGLAPATPLGCAPVGLREAGSPDSVDAETVFQAGSISKPTFAVLAMRLVEDGALELDQDVNERLRSWRVPDNRFTRTEKVTLRRLLSHRAGLTAHGFPGYPPGQPVPTVVQILDGAPPASTTGGSASRPPTPASARPSCWPTPTRPASPPAATCPPASRSTPAVG